MCRRREASAPRGVTMSSDSDKEEEEEEELCCPRRGEVAG